MPKKSDDYDITPIRMRLQEYLASEHLNNRRFEEKCGLYNGFVRALDTKISFESLAKIGGQCPNLNLGWVFSGVGDMIIHQKPDLVSAQVATSVNMENVQAVFITNVDAIATAVAKVLEKK